MQPAEIIAQIRPCDMDQSYIFISYSAQDYVRVWEDVYTFQQLGYNVWLDEKNLDKTKASWTEDALAAISDLDCLLVVFYVSQYSLTSENCFRELCQTTAKDTTELHFGPVPFIAVDAENVGNIGAYTKAIHKQVLAQPISKQEKGQKARTLSRFVELFFDSNNERVRVHPKDEPGRKTNYYQEIVSSFPDECKVFPATITLPKPAPTPVPQPAPAPEAAPTPAPQQEQSAPEGETLADQIARQLGRMRDPIASESFQPAPDYPGPGTPPAPEASPAPAEEDAPAEGDASLAAQISSLLGRAAGKGEDAPPAQDAGSGEAGEDKKPSLAEQIQRKLEEQRKGDKGGKK